MYPISYTAFPAFRQPAPAGDSLFVFAYRLLRIWRRSATRRVLANCASKQA